MAKARIQLHYKWYFTSTSPSPTSLQDDKTRIQPHKDRGSLTYPPMRGLKYPDYWANSHVGHKDRSSLTYPPTEVI